MIKKDIIEHCKLSDLIISDIVLISHASTYTQGYWKNWDEEKYIFIGIKNDEYHFEHIEYRNEHFRMSDKKEINNHKFIGRVISLERLRKYKIEKLKNKNYENK